ncbi:MAG: RNA polymerase sigma factor [Bradymonadaceae bacterium]|nr:RNA polymerase sigma factor [Lujinxingiaceae bacterium]
MTSDDEATWVRRLKQGDEAAFERLIDTYYGAMLRLARSLCPDPATAEDVVQETWFAILSAIARFEGRSTLKTWIFAILTNQARKRAAKDRRFAAWLLGDTTEDEAIAGPDCATAQAAMSPWPLDAEAKVHRDQVLTIVQEAIENLPSNQRTVVILRDIEGLEPAEVCELLKITDGNQRVLLHRGRVSIRNTADQALNPNPEMSR